MVSPLLTISLPALLFRHSVLLPTHPTLYLRVPRISCSGTISPSCMAVPSARKRGSLIAISGTSSSWPLVRCSRSVCAMISFHTGLPQ
ncbi:hypothetical protein EDB84DRAFT_1474780 [Lactarius hengduanensis]|nr:hypothetical protein EDB84DRAFT_1474780 [Lactarius hengduanensis]